MIRSTPPMNSAKKTTKSNVMIVDPINSSRPGHSIFKNSDFTCPRNSVIFIQPPSSSVFSVRGRPGGIRTPNPQIWSLPLYRFELPASALFGFFVCHMAPTARAIFIQLQAARRTLFSDYLRVIAFLALIACQMRHRSIFCHLMQPF